MKIKIDSQIHKKLKIKNQKNQNNNNYKHGMWGKSIYNRWKHIKQRCYNPKDAAYKNYGGRGIKICDEWLDKEKGFINFYNWAINNGYKDNLTIDRIDNNGDYSPNNCRWVTMKIQANNTRHNKKITFKNETHTLTEWSEILNINLQTLAHRIKNKNKTIEECFVKSPTTKKKVNQYDLNNNFIKQYESISSALGPQKSPKIINCCKGKAKTAYGFIWRYADEDNH